MEGMIEWEMKDLGGCALVCNVTYQVEGRAGQGGGAVSEGVSLVTRSFRKVSEWMIRTFLIKWGRGDEEERSYAKGARMLDN